MNDLIPSTTDVPVETLSADAEGEVSLPQDIVEQLRDGGLKQQLQLIDTIAQAGHPSVLMAFLKQQMTEPPNATPAVGYALQMLSQSSASGDELDALADALVPMPSDRQIDYCPLRQHLMTQDFQAADRVTLEKLCELAGAAAVKRKWLYFSEVNQFPVADLTTIDLLWRIFSQGKFGFSVQRDLWLSVGQNWGRLWPKIGWRSETWTRYPDEFTWSLSAPRGHLPLSNQLRGVRAMAALMNHPAWNPPQS
ncbi:MAG: GUN4 domain-containing protein [Elainellaceae cyanobacterium]